MLSMVWGYGLCQIALVQCHTHSLSTDSGNAREICAKWTNCTPYHRQLLGKEKLHILEQEERAGVVAYTLGLSPDNVWLWDIQSQQEGGSAEGSLTPTYFFQEMLLLNLLCFSFKHWCVPGSRPGSSPWSSASRWSQHHSILKTKFTYISSPNSPVSSKAIYATVYLITASQRSSWHLKLNMAEAELLISPPNCSSSSLSHLSK